MATTRFSKSVATRWCAEAEVQLDGPMVDIIDTLRERLVEGREYYDPQYLDQMADRMASMIATTPLTEAPVNNESDAEYLARRMSRMSGYEVDCDCGERMEECSPYHFICRHPENHPGNKSSGPGKMAYTREDKERWRKIK